MSPENGKDMVKAYRSQCLLPQNMIWKQAMMCDKTYIDHLKSQVPITSQPYYKVTVLPISTLPYLKESVIRSVVK